MAGGNDDKHDNEENQEKEVGGADEVENKESGDEELNGESETGTPKKSPSKSPTKSPKKKEEKSPSKSPSKSDKKNDEEEESDKDMEDEASDSDEDSDEEGEELPPGLLERPLEIEGKREKKKVERLTSAALHKTPEEKPFTIEEGKGVKLGDIPVVQENLTSSRAIDCKPLHHVLFVKIGKLHEVKKNIRKFSGEPKGKDSIEHEKRMVILNRQFLPQLKSFCQILNLPSQGQKQDIIDRLEEFILKPVDTGDKVAKPQKRKRSKTPSGKKTKKSKTDKDKKKKKEKKEKKEKKAKKAKASEDELSDLSDDEDEAPKKKKIKLSPKKSTPAKSEKKTPTKKNTPKKSEKKPKSPKKTPKKKAEDSDDSDSEDEPLARLKESPPSNSDIKSLVQKILKGADLEKVTMKTVVKQVYAKYPKFDLTDRKEFIKDSVRRIIS